MRRSGLLVVVCSLVACSEPASIEVQPEQRLISSKTETLQLRATVKDKDGKVLSQAPVTWQSMTPTMANVDTGGNVTAVTSGTASILATSGKVSKEFEVIVSLPKRIAFDPDKPLLMMGITKGFKVTVYNDRDQPLIAGELRWSTSDPKIFTVDKFGNVKTIEEGTAILTVHALGIEGKNEITVKHEELHEDGSLSQ